MTTPGAGVASLIAGYFKAPAQGAPPQAQATGAPQTPGGFQLLDYRRVTANGDAKAGAAGTIQATFSPVPAGQLWLVERMVVECTSTAATIALVYVGSVSAANIADGSVAGNLDFADNSSPLLVPGSQSLIVLWEGADLNSTAFAAAQVRILG